MLTALPLTRALGPPWWWHTCSHHTFVCMQLCVCTLCVYTLCVHTLCMCTLCVYIQFVYTLMCVCTCVYTLCVCTHCVCTSCVYTLCVYTLCICMRYTLFVYVHVCIYFLCVHVCVYTLIPEAFYILVFVSWLYHRSWWLWARCLSADGGFCFILLSFCGARDWSQGFTSSKEGYWYRFVYFGVCVHSVMCVYTCWWVEARSQCQMFSCYGK